MGIVNILLGAFLTLLFALPSAFSGTQLEEYKKAYDLHVAASDKSFNNSVIFAMRALLDLEAAKIPSAVSNAYSAYGQYRKSDTLDGLAIRDQFEQLKISSLGIKNVGATGGWQESGLNIGSSTIQDPTANRKNKTKFLYEGEAAVFAKEFEKKTGLKREQFHQFIHSLGDMEIYSEDPEAFNKSVAKLDSFLKAIPNRDFREKVQSVTRKIPLGYQMAGFQKGLKIVATIEEGINVGINKVAELVGKASEDSVAVAKNEAVEEKPKGNSNPSNSSDFSNKKISGQRFYGLQGEAARQDVIKEIVGESQESGATSGVQDEKSLFDRVSNKLRTNPDFFGVQ